MTIKDLASMIKDKENCSYCVMCCDSATPGLNYDRLISKFGDLCVVKMSADYSKSMKRVCYTFYY